jgi:hypothetical protein
VANQDGGQPPQVNLAANLIAAVENQRRLMEEALMRLGLSEVAPFVFMNNGMNSLQRWCLLTEGGLDRLIKQIHHDNQGAGLFIPFFSQESIHAIHFWTNCMYILGIPYEIDQVTKEHALVWNQAWKSVEVKERSK